MNEFLNFFKNKFSPNRNRLGGFFVGEKVLYLATQDKFVYLCGDFVSASKLKRGLEAFGKRVYIVSCGRENDDERDLNLFPFASAVSKFLAGEIDYLIFLPSSMTTKFDLEFLKQKFLVGAGQTISIESLTKTFSEFGFERVDFVSMPGQFAVRGDIIDIFVDGEDAPNRIEFFDEEIEKIIKFDFSR